MVVDVGPETAIGQSGALNRTNVVSRGKSVVSPGVKASQTKGLI